MLSSKACSLVCARPAVLRMFAPRPSAPARVSPSTLKRLLHGMELRTLRREMMGFSRRGPGSQGSYVSEARGDRACGPGRGGWVHVKDREAARVRGALRPLLGKAGSSNKTNSPGALGGNPALHNPSVSEMKPTQNFRTSGLGCLWQYATKNPTYNTHKN